MKGSMTAKQSLKAISALSALLLASSLMVTPAFAASGDSDIRELKDVARIPDEAYAEMMALSPRLSSNDDGEHLSIHVKEDGEQIIARNATDTEFGCDFTRFKYSQTEQRAKENTTATYVKVIHQEDDTPKWSFQVWGNHRYNSFTNETCHTNAYCDTKGEAIINQNVYEHYDEIYPSASRENCRAMLRTIRLKPKGAVSGVWSPDSVNTDGMRVLNPI